MYESCFYSINNTKAWISNQSNNKLYLKKQQLYPSFWNDP